MELVAKANATNPDAGKAVETAPEIPGVSVVIVNWNTREMVLRLLKGLSASSSSGAPSTPALELIVVDNNSSDGSAEAIAAELPSVKLIRQRENRGFAGGVNPGVRAATQPLVLLLNSDARTTRESIGKLAAYMASHPQVGIVGPRMLNSDGSVQSSCWRDPSLKWIFMSVLGLDKIRALNFERYQERIFEEAAEVECVCGSAMMIRRDLLEQLGGLDEDYFMYFEETDFCLRTRRRGLRVHHAPLGKFLHESGGTSKRVRLRTYLDFRRSQILFQLKHNGPVAALAARGLLAASCAVRLPPLLLLSVVGRSKKEYARGRLNLNIHGLIWLLNPRAGLVPNVDRSQ